MFYQGTNYGGLNSQDRYLQDPSYNGPFIPNLAPQSQETNTPYGSLGQTAAAGMPTMAPGMTKNLTDTPNAVFQNIADFGPGYGAQTIAGDSYNRAQLGRYNSYENIYGRGVTPFALKSQAEGGLGMEPNQVNIFGAQAPTVWDSTPYYENGVFAFQPRAYNAFTGQQGLVGGQNEYPGIDPIFKQRNTVFDPISQIPQDMRDFSTASITVGPGIPGAGRWSSYFNDGNLQSLYGQLQSYKNYRNPTLSGMSNVVQRDANFIPSLNTFRNDYILNSMPTPARVGSSGSMQGNTNFYNWMQAARPYVGQDSIDSIMHNYGLR